MHGGMEVSVFNSINIYSSPVPSLESEAFKPSYQKLQANKRKTLCSSSDAFSIAMQNTTTLCSTFGHTGPFQTNLITPHTREDGTLSLTFGSEKSMGIWALQESYAWLGTTPWVSFPCTPTWTCRCRSASLWASSSPWVHWSLARSSSSTSTSGCSCFCFPGGHTRIGEKAAMGPSSRCNHTSGWQQLQSSLAWDEERIPHLPVPRVHQTAKQTWNSTQVGSVALCEDEMWPHKGLSTVLGMTVP